MEKLELVNQDWELLILRVDSPFDFNKGSVGFARTQKYNTEDSQFFIVLRDEPLYETEYTPIGKVLYGLRSFRKN